VPSVNNNGQKEWSRQRTERVRASVDFDGFFASVEQQARPRLRGRPVGMVPFAGTRSTCVIACSKEAKSRGVKNVMPVADALRVCPDLVLAPQSPDLYRRAHNAPLSEIVAVIPIAAVKSIDELTCDLGPRDIRDPESLAGRIKRRIRDHVGPYVTCSIGFAAHRQLAKIATPTFCAAPMRSSSTNCAAMICTTRSARRSRYICRCTPSASWATPGATST